MTLHRSTYRPSREARIRAFCWGVIFTGIGMVGFAALVVAL